MNLNWLALPLGQLLKLKSFEPIDYRKFEPAPIVGVDEVGRGCLAGPVFAAAVVLRSEAGCEFFRDSKKISEKRRYEIAPLIESEHWVGIGSASVEEIDELNILQAALLAMKRAVLSLEEKMGSSVGHVLVDGSFKIPDLKRQQTCIVKGDDRVLPISAASIVAKVHRDLLMKEQGKKYPQFLWEDNKGYGSEKHREAIKHWGPTEWHRKSFSGVKEYI